MNATNSSIGDPLILNALIDILKNGQGQQITMMVHEAISKVTPSSMNPFGMKDPTMPSNASTVMPEDIILDIARKYMHSKQDNLRSKLTKDLRFPCLAWITDQVTWDEFMKDAKFKRKAHNNPNYRPSTRGESKRRLRDTTKATQARVSSIGSHKLGFGGYNSIHGGLVHQFQREASEEDLKYSLLHVSQGPQQNLIDQGEILVSGHEFEEAQQSNSTGSEHEEELEDHDELFVAHNYSIVIPKLGRKPSLNFNK
ncbi:hypothetical protein SUGI_0366580 [Cryptomeria japonica]|nr:hypothetical protein SUGI_0366580 [Cryptomeria japonica]